MEVKDFRLLSLWSGLIVCANELRVSGGVF
jgi:hypothetical protein